MRNNDGCSVFYSTLVHTKSPIEINFNSFTSIRLPNLEIAGAIVISDNKLLESVEINAVTAESIKMETNGRLTNASFPRLATLAGRNSFIAHLVALNLPSLRVIKIDRASYFDVKGNIFTELALPRLETSTGKIRIQNNTPLSDLSLPRLYNASYLDISWNARLHNVTANVLRYAGSIILDGGAFTNVEFFSLQEVTGDFKVVGDPSMDCS